MGLAGSDRGTFHGNLTADEAKERLALPVFHVLAGHAFVCFPGSTASRPSRYVEFRWGAKYAGQYDGSMPIRVNLNQYRKAVLPVMLDQSNHVHRPINLVDIQEGNPTRERYIQKLGDRLRQCFELNGF